MFYCICKFSNGAWAEILIGQDSIYVFQPSYSKLAIFINIIIFFALADARVKFAIEVNFQTRLA